MRNIGDTYRDVIQLCKTASSSAHCAKGDALIKDEAILVLVLQLYLFMKASGSERDHTVSDGLCA